MELAEKIYQCLSGNANSHKLLNALNEIEGKNTLAYINEFFMENYDNSLQELISEIFGVEELYAISSTLKYIREPNSKNYSIMDNFYKEIGYQFSS
jgi:hypothetical protein